MPDIPTEALIMREAKAILLRDGWYQGSSHGPGGTHCLWGAIHLGTRRITNSWESDVIDPARDMALDRIYKHVASLIGSGIGTWNDVKGRTFDEVLDVIDKAEWNFQEGLVE